MGYEPTTCAFVSQLDLLDARYNCATVYPLLQLLQAIPPPPRPPDLPVYVDQSIRYTDYLSITLTALAVVLAALAIAIAIAAVWGYTTIKEEASRLAKAAALEAAKATVGAFLESPDFRDTLKSAVRDGKAQPEPKAEPGQRLGKPYPEEETK